MFFPIELWREICGYLIHNIKKHGKQEKQHRKVTGSIVISDVFQCVGVKTVAFPNFLWLPRPA